MIDQDYNDSATNSNFPSSSDKVSFNKITPATDFDEILTVLRNKFQSLPPKDPLHIGILIILTNWRSLSLSVVLN